MRRQAIHKFGFALLLIFSAVFGRDNTTCAEASDTATLGDEIRVTALFSFPNCENNCAETRTLQETVEHYFKQSMERDGYKDSSVQINNTSGQFYARFTGSAAERYPGAVEAFLNAGDLGLTGESKLKADGKWKPNWRFFLPLGLALTNHPTVELLHFPPDYVLSRDQDYMAAKTTLRWTDLLEHNGLTSDEAVRDQAIIDIAPIAAPANDGKNLEGVYSSFEDYIRKLLELWDKSAEKDVAEPIVAFGGPVREWLKSTFSIGLNVGQLGTLNVPSVGNAPILAANHPSFIFYVVSRKGDSDQQRFENGMATMKQDVVAACWQARMGRQPSSDATEALQHCGSQWEPRTLDICVLLETEAYGKSSAEALQFCQGGPLQGFAYPSEASVRNLEATAPAF